MFAKTTRRTLLSLGVAVLLPVGSAAAAELIKLGNIADPGYDSALWALVNGKVKDPSVEVKVDSMTIPALMQAAMTQQYHILPNGILAVPQMVEQGIPVRIVGTVLRYHPAGHSDDLWVMKDSKIKTPADLKGKTIGVTTVEAQNIVSIRAVLSERYKLNAASIGGDMKWASIPSAQFEAALRAGRVDAVAFSNVAAYFATKGGAYRSILHGSKELKEMYGGPMPSVVLTAYQPDLDKRPQAYIAALKLLKASAQYALDHQKEVFAAVAPKYKMSPEDLQTWFTTYAEMPYALGPTDKAVFMKAWVSGNKLGSIKKVPADVESLVWKGTQMQ
ncbi:MAG: ABC transporter substrate-binding protein [Rhodospirillaceae bacterium]|nr:ABC transporter substrate-binding protein [Rhodospirillaceae bacterium]